MPLRELERLQVVNKYLTIDFSLHNELQEIVKTAALICGCPTALISLISEHTQYIRYKQAFAFDQTRREDAFCNFTIESKDFFLVEDALSDARFINNLLVNEAPFIRFYAGIPLVTHDGHQLGSLCVIDQQPKTISAIKLKMLALLAKHTMQIFEFDLSLSVLKVQFIEAKKNEIKLRSFFESTTSEHIMIDKEYNILAFNKKLLDFVQKEYHITIEKGMKVTTFVRENYMEDFLINCRKALAGERVQHERLIQFGQTSHWCDITYDPSWNSEGEVTGISYNSTDITSLVLEQQNVLKHQNSLAKIAFMQSHELRRPVANIKGILSLLKDDQFFAKYPLMLEIQTDIENLDKNIQTIIRYTDV